MTDIRIVSDSGGLSASVLTKYLETQRQRFIRDYGAVDGEAQFALLQHELERHFERLGRFLAPRAADGTSELVIGRVQSGKTAHFLASLAWAADNGFAGAIVVSGRTTELSRQTRDRIEHDLAELGTWPMVRIYEAPTTGRPDAELARKFPGDIRKRLDTNGASAPMPILVTLKTGSRIDVATELLAQITDHSDDGESPLYLIIDDETDQASQNAAARAGRETAIYRALRELRRAAGTHLFLGYTATPQAVLLTDPDNAVGPQYLHVVEPGRGYFGLNDLLWLEQSDSARAARLPHQRMHEVTDFLQFTPAGAMADSLRSALLRFLVVGGVRRCFPEVFFSRAPQGISLTDRARHVAFLVHPSRETVPQETAAILLDNYFADSLFTSPGRTEELKTDHLLPAYVAWRDQLPPATRAKTPDPVRGLASVENLLDDIIQGVRNYLQLRVVNASTAGSPVGRGFPRDSDWSRAAYWILIGGEILGRGMTIPNLVGTYFLRNPNGPTQDTAVQQMRFCGYRQDYADHIDVWAPGAVISHYMDIDAIEEVMLNFYRRYDREETLVTSGLDIVYVAPANTRLKPTRRGVISTRTLQDTSTTSTLLATLSIGGPQITVANAAAVSGWLKPLDPDGWPRHRDEWRSTQIGASDLQELVSSFACAAGDSKSKKLVRGALDAALGPWSLNHHTFRMFVQQAELLTSDVQEWDPTSGTTGPLRSRSRSSGSVRLAPSAAAWRAQVRSHVAGGLLVPTATFEGVRIGSLVGGEHRSLRDSTRNADSVCVFLQLIGIADGGPGDDDRLPVASRKAIGIALSVLAPPGLKVIRMMGHR